MDDGWKFGWMPQRGDTQRAGGGVMEFKIEPTVVFNTKQLTDKVLNYLENKVEHSGAEKAAALCAGDSREQDAASEVLRPHLSVHHLKQPLPSSNPFANSPPHVSSSSNFHLNLNSIDKLLLPLCVGLITQSISIL
ncbi:unnamed protein product [Pleuronectes platessa]|uniref:Uncharacterized protein n=1 Tax=Pleuronectes platessa TaxID=8262 RepID=A0A9N7TP93_PLEPL|nr:unnamed protein product [Pleuronectes platessa]